MTHQIDLEDDEDFRLIGFYSSEAAGYAAIEQLRMKPGFRDFPNGFIIGPMVVDMTYWEGGFFTVYDDDPAEVSNDGD